MANTREHRYAVSLTEGQQADSRHLYRRGNWSIASAERRSVDLQPVSL